MQAMGRQLLSDANYVNKLAEGKAKEIKRCTRCNTCMARMTAGMTPACAINPELGREYRNDDNKLPAKWEAHESLMPAGLMMAKMPALDRPWWKTELTVSEKNWRPLRGRTPR